MTNPGVQEFVRQTIRHATETWGFKYLKLDFLYAAALAGKPYHYVRTYTEHILSSNAYALSIYFYC